LASAAIISRRSFSSLARASFSTLHMCSVCQDKELAMVCLQARLSELSSMSLALTVCGGYAGGVRSDI
jgi:hypothetical protein